MNEIRKKIKKCRICLTDYYEEGGFVKLLNNDTNNLTISGKLFEELLDLPIDLTTIHGDPQYLCSSCDLQIKLFKNLKVRAHETAYNLNKKHNQYLGEINRSPKAQAISACDERNQVSTNEVYEAVDYDYGNHCETNTFTQNIIQEEISSTQPNHNEISLEACEGLPYQQQTMDDSLDYETEIAIDSNDTENRYGYDSTDYEDIVFLDDNLLQNCNSDAKETNVNSKSGINSEKPQSGTYIQCNECEKRFRTSESQQAHYNVAHLEVPAYQCSLCPKTFNQKGHYLYHMNRHNNVRRFKCNICEKSFLSKTDLLVHIRFHNGERPYKCEICGNDYSLMQHLKSHMYSHSTVPKFTCKICNQKFINPTTLRTHMTSIHTKPRFQCEHCIKRFRRKHHLLAHYKVHEKQLKTNGCPTSTTKTQTSVMPVCGNNDMLEMFGNENVNLLIDYDDVAAINSADDSVFLFT